MRLGLVVILGVGSWTVAVAQDVASTNVDCVQRLEMPGYHRFAIAARIQGTITTSVLLSPTASPQEITSREEGLSEALTNGLNILVPSIKQVVKKLGVVCCGLDFQKWAGSDCFF